MSIRIHSYSLICLLFLGTSSALPATGAGAGDPLLSAVKEIVGAIPPASSHAYSAPSDRELDDWRVAIDAFRAGKFDSCRALLARMNYSLGTVKDQASGATIDVFRENFPVNRGWGTLLHNRGARKPLNVHVAHPVDDPNMPAVAVELFRTSGAKWLLMGGSWKHAAAGSSAADMAVAPRSVFQRWHEILTDPSQMTVSLHTYSAERYPFPISVSEVVLSNGRTSDVQWGISQLSLAFRDSLRASGYRAAVAMLDSGFARLAAAGNPQAVWSNDHYGFGRWINLEISAKVRNDNADLQRLVRVTDRVLSLPRQGLARKGEKRDDAFGLVSPRVVRIDKSNRLLFPPPQAEKYRIVSFNAGKSAKDTLDLLFGNWVGTNGGGIARIVEVDTTSSITGSPALPTVTKLVSPPPGKFVSGIRPVEHRPADTLASAEEDGEVREPIQVHRIPLQPVLASTVSPEYEPAVTPFRWGGILPEGFTPQIFTYRSAAHPDISGMDIPGLSRFLIPLLKSSYSPGGTKFVGVDMTDLLVNEIARLVSEYRVDGHEIGLVAEQGEDGDYYLRLFPGKAPVPPVTTSSNLP